MWCVLSNDRFFLLHIQMKFYGHKIYSFSENIHVYEWEKKSPPTQRNIGIIHNSPRDLILISEQKLKMKKNP